MSKSDNLHNSELSAYNVKRPLTTEEVKKSYSLWSSVYDYSFALFARSAKRNLTQFINKRCGRGGKLLEVGVGTGVALPLYDRQKFSITGIDLSSSMLKKARKRVKKNNLHHVCALEEMDASCLNFNDEEFDIVVASHVISVVSTPILVLKELERVCKKGGHIVIMNHFASTGGNTLNRLEKIFAPMSPVLGWHSDFPQEIIMDHTSCTLLDKISIGHFDIFTLLLLNK